MYRCNRCSAEFDEPDTESFCYEDYNGVGSMFEDRHYGESESCPECGSEDFSIIWDDEYDDVRSLCDINDCADCPRKGDDCDGRYEDDDDEERS